MTKFFILLFTFSSTHTWSGFNSLKNQPLGILGDSSTAIISTDALSRVELFAGGSADFLVGIQ